MFYTWHIDYSSWYLHIYLMEFSLWKLWIGLFDICLNTSSVFVVKSNVICVNWIKIKILKGLPRITILQKNPKHQMDLHMIHRGCGEYRLIPLIVVASQNRKLSKTAIFKFVKTGELYQVIHGKMTPKQLWDRYDKKEKNVRASIILIFTVNWN